MIAVPIFFKRKPGKVVAGAGLLSRTVGRGHREHTVLYAVSGKESFTGAWWTQAHDIGGGNIEATVSKGFINGMEPMVKGGNLVSEGIVKAKMEGSRAWVVVRVMVNGFTGRMLSQEQDEVTPDHLRVEILPSPKGSPGTLGRFGYAPLAMLHKKNGILHVYQIAYFSYRHSTTRRFSSSNWRHFFHVA